MGALELIARWRPAVPPLPDGAVAQGDVAVDGATEHDFRYRRTVFFYTGSEELVSDAFFGKRRPIGDFRACACRIRRANQDLSAIKLVLHGQEIGREYIIMI